MGLPRIHGELLVPGIKIAASTVWEILRDAGIDPGPQRTSDSAARVTRAGRNLAMDLEDAGRTARYLIRDRDGKFPILFDTILADTGIEVVHSGVQMPA